MISQIANFVFVLITFKCISNSVAAAKNIKEIIEFHFSLLIHYPFGLVFCFLFLLNEKNINFHEVLHDFIDHRMSFQIFISLHSGHINVYSKLNTSRYSFVLKCFCSFFFFLFYEIRIDGFFIILEIKKKYQITKIRVVCGDIFNFFFLLAIFLSLLLWLICNHLLLREFHFFFFFFSRHLYIVRQDINEN